MDAIFWSSTTSDWDVISRYIGPYKIARWIEKYGYSSQVIDFVNYLDEYQLYTATKKFITKDTLVIGISTTFLVANLIKWSDGSISPFPEHVLKTARLLKDEHPNIKFVLGGYGSEHIYGGDTFSACIMSYTEASEDIFLEYINHLKFKTEPPLSTIITSYYHLSADYIKNNKIKHRVHYNKARKKIYNIEVDDFKFKKQDAILEGEALPLDISRGCIFACRFCNYPHLGKGKLDYIRGMEYIKQELIYNYENFKTSNYMILDDTFNETPQKMQSFLEMTKSLPFKINYSAYLRADLINRFPDTAYMLKESGLWGAFHGLESLHPYASNLVGKAWSGKDAREFIPKLYHDLWNSQIPQLLNFIVGFPKEGPEDVFETLRWFKDNNLYSIGYEKLGLNNPKLSHRYSILSEFEKNSEKYGFTFMDDVNTYGKRLSWFNETWQPDLLVKTHQNIYNFIDSNKLRKATIWNLGNLQLLGYNKDYLLKTPKSDYDMNNLNSRRSGVYQQYYEKLMNL